ncbi:hypothetical protein [Mycoplasma crocodyli]|nr:hypothetical protein [Mycoplasma crocodyli]
MTKLGYIGVIITLIFIVSPLLILVFLKVINLIVDNTKWDLHL